MLVVPHLHGQPRLRHLLNAPTNYPNIERGAIDILQTDLLILDIDGALVHHEAQTDFFGFAVGVPELVEEELGVAQGGVVQGEGFC